MYCSARRRRESRPDSKDSVEIRMTAKLCSTKNGGMRLVTETVIPTGLIPFGRGGRELYPSRVKQGPKMTKRPRRRVIGPARMVPSHDGAISRCPIRKAALHPTGPQHLSRKRLGAGNGWVPGDAPLTRSGDRGGGTERWCMVTSLGPWLHDESI